MSRYALPKGYLSASAIKTLQTCPRQYEFRYVRGIINPPNAALTTGSVAHKTIETYYNDAITSSSRLTPAQAAELSGDTFEEYIRENETVMSQEERNEAHRILPDIVSRYVDCIGQHITPQATEKEFRFKMACGVDLLGYIDLLYDKEGETAIADYKVTSKKLTYNDLANSLQFNLYALATGIGDIQIHNLVKTVGKPAAKRSTGVDGVMDYASNLRTISHVFDGSQVSHFEYLVESAAKLISSGIFMPCSPDSWCCNENWCGYWHLCRGRNNI